MEGPGGTGSSEAPSRRRLVAGLGLCAVIGLYDGFCGPGTGSFLVFVFVRVVGFDFLRATGCAKFVNCAADVGALVWFLPTGVVDENGSAFSISPELDDPVLVMDVWYGNLGLDDGVAKTPRWAADISGLPAESLVALARRMAGKTTMVMVSWSLQRVRYGEQAPWMGLTLASMLGQIGVPGGGFGHGYGSQNEVGMAPLRPSVHVVDDIDSHAAILSAICRACPSGLQPLR